MRRYHRHHLKSTFMRIRQLRQFSPMSDSHALIISRNTRLVEGRMVGSCPPTLSTDMLYRVFSVSNHAHLRPAVTKGKA